MLALVVFVGFIGSAVAGASGTLPFNDGAGTPENPAVAWPAFGSPFACGLQRTTSGLTGTVDGADCAGMFDAGQANVKVAVTWSGAGGAYVGNGLVGSGGDYLILFGNAGCWWLRHGGSSVLWSGCADMGLAPVLDVRFDGTNLHAGLNGSEVWSGTPSSIGFTPATSVFVFTSRTSGVATHVEVTDNTPGCGLTDLSCLAGGLGDIVSAITHLGDRIAGFFTSLASGIASGLASVVSAVEAVPAAIADAIGSLLRALFIPSGSGWHGFFSTIQDAADRTPLRWLHDIVTWVTDLPGDLEPGGATCGAYHGIVTPGGITPPSMCSIVASGAGAGDWSVPRLLLRCLLWATCVLALYRSTSRVLSGS